MKDTLFIITFGLLCYLGFATLFGDSALIGTYGATFALYNHKYFGYISFIYIFISLAPLYLLYKNSALNMRKFEISIASFLVFFSFLLAQSLLVTDNLRGKIGGDFVDFLSPYIGVFGLWVFWSIITMLSIVIFLDRSTHELVDMILERLKHRLDIKSDTAEEYRAETMQQNNDTSFSHVEEESVELPTEPIPDLIEIEFEEEIDKPTYLRREGDVSVLKPAVKEPIKKSSQEKPQNILDLVNEIKEHSNAVVVDELEENAKLLASIEKGKVEKPKNFTLPSMAE